MMSTSFVNQSLFGEQEEDEMGGLIHGQLPLPVTNMIFPHHFHFGPSSNILSPNSQLTSEPEDSTISNLTPHQTLLSSHSKSSRPLGPFAPAQFLSLNRSTFNPWALVGEVHDCLGSKRSHGVQDDDHHHHVGVSSTMKMKRIIKGRRKVREPRFCFKTMSDVDVLDDGYKWRKYGQKVVKNTQHPRSYYRCTQDNCRVKKRVERLAEDPRMVITTYEGRHAHSPSNDLDDSQSPSQLSNFFW